MKKLISKIRRFFVVSYANYSYNKMVNLAEKLHHNSPTGDYGNRQFVVLLPEKARLTVIDRRSFRKHKRLLSYENRTMDDLRKGCIYHTSDKLNTHPMSSFDKGIRRIAFVKLVLQKSKL